MTNQGRALLTATHWGTYQVGLSSGRVASLKGFAQDDDPSPIGDGILDVLDGPTRILAPMVRKGWLERRGTPSEATGEPPGKGRGTDPFVQVSWDEVNRLVADELDRVKASHGNQAIFAGSYGWASAGRFHHAQSQLKRFLNCIGGFTYSRNTYSYAAAEVLVPHVLGSFLEHLDTTTSWESIASDCELFVGFGGVPLKNGQICQGGTGSHVQAAGLKSAQSAGVEFVNASPLRSDIPDEVGAQWIALRPGTDTALLLGLAHTLLSENLHDTEFLERFTVGFDQFASYLKGEADGTEKSADWAAEICDITADEIRKLARRMRRKRTMISVSWSLTRQANGEQPFWAAIALASMIGQIGLPGTGIAFGYSAMNHVGGRRRKIPFAAFPQGDNPIKDFIPVARISDMLEKPGGQFDYNGKSYTYPDIRLLWWAGGNPFHHHQDLNRLRSAWKRPETVIVNDWCWNSTARHADIVLPTTTHLERSDIALTSKDPFLVAMDQAIQPIGEARNDHEIFCGIAALMGVEKTFTGGRSSQEWQRWIYETSRENAAKVGIDLPDWTTFQRDGWFKVPPPETPTIMMGAFRADPERNPLKTPSGKIEIYSATIAGFGYNDCPGHPSWRRPVEWLGDAGAGELHLLSNQPRNKLHSQLDHGAVSQKDRIKGREVVTMNPLDASQRGAAPGDIVRIHNRRGACLAALAISEDIRPGVIQMATGAWFEPDGDTCQNGNPNVLTPDKGTSSLAQGPIANTCLVSVELCPEAEERYFRMPTPLVLPQQSMQTKTKGRCSHGT